MNSLVMFSATLALAFGVYIDEKPHSHSSLSDVIARPIVSKRDNTSPVSQNDVFDLIKQTVAHAHSGTTSQELALAAVNVKAVLDNLIGLDMSTIDPNEIRALIEQISSSIGAQTAVSALFDDSLTYEGEKMAAALELWESLADTAREQQAAGQSTSVTLAAIVNTANAITTIVADTVSLLDQLITLPVNIKVGSGRQARRSLGKRGWSAGLNLSHGSHSGTFIGADIGFSF